jgi:epoxyqueuosine reductase QueG
MSSLTEEVKEYCRSLGGELVGIGRSHRGLVVVIGVRMADSVVEGAPSREYYELVISESRRLDEIAVMVERFLTARGYSAQAIPASREEGFSHKYAGVCAGLGFIGKSGLLITDFGPRVRLVSVCTDAPLEVDGVREGSGCVGCNCCVCSCPVGAISDVSFDADACEFYNNRVLAQGGEYGACGVCVKVCPSLGASKKDDTYILFQ